MRLSEPVPCARLTSRTGGNREKIRVAQILVGVLCGYCSSRYRLAWSACDLHSAGPASARGLRPQLNLYEARAATAGPALASTCGIQGLQRRLFANAMVVASSAGVIWPLNPGCARAEEIEVTASPDDVRIMQGALSALNKLGDFPSQTALADADLQLTACIERWQTRGISRVELSSLFRRRSDVRLRGGDLSAALQDLGSALQVMKNVKPGSAESFDELPNIYLARAETLAGARRWKDALSDYNKAVDLLGEPIEDAVLLSGRGLVEQKLGMMAAAARDFDDSAAVFKSKGARVEAEIAAERAGIALIGAGEANLDDAEERLCGVIRRSIGTVSKSVSSLQQLVIADCDARYAMAAVSWHRGRTEMAETYWRDAVARLDQLYNETLGMETSVNGFPGGVPYRGNQYASDFEWLRGERAWPDTLVAWLQEFLRERPGTPPRASYVQDLVVGKRPGDGSNIAEVLRAGDEFRKVRGPFKLPDMDVVEQWLRPGR